MAIFKGLEPQNSAFSGIFGIQLIVNVQCWILMASAVYKNLEQLLRISNQVECHESGMSRSNSKKSYVDVQTLLHGGSLIPEYDSIAIALR